MLYACLGTLNDNYVEANIEVPVHILSLIEMTSQLIDQGLAGQIGEKYFQEGKEQFQQSVVKLNERCKSLEVERKNLLYKIQKSKKGKNISVEEEQPGPEGDDNQFGQDKGSAQPMERSLEGTLDLPSVSNKSAAMRTEMSAVPSGGSHLGEQV